MTPARLSKKSDNHFDNDFFCRSFKDKIGAWCIKHAPILLTLVIILSLLLFLVACYAFVGVSATESGTVYNQFNNII